MVDSDKIGNSCELFCDIDMMVFDENYYSINELSKIINLEMYCKYRNIPSSEVISVLQSDGLIRLKRAIAGGIMVSPSRAVRCFFGNSGFVYSWMIGFAIVDRRNEAEVRYRYNGGVFNSIEMIMNLLCSGKCKSFNRSDVFSSESILEILIYVVIHNDYSLSRIPEIRIFDDRMEFEFAVKSLVGFEMCFDSKIPIINHNIVALIKVFNLYKNEGFGLASVAIRLEKNHFPPLRFESVESSKNITIYRYKEFHKISKKERVETCFQHACLRWSEGEHLTNASLRKRFGLMIDKKTTVSRIIHEAVEANVIRCFDDNVAPKLRSYVPYWAFDQ